MTACDTWSCRDKMGNEIVVKESTPGFDEVFFPNGKSVVMATEIITTYCANCMHSECSMMGMI